MAKFDLGVLLCKIPSSVKPEISKYQRYANTLKKELLHDDFIRTLNGWKFTPEMIRDLISVMLEYPKYSLNTMQMEWLEEYRNSIVTAYVDVTINEPSYSDDLIDYNLDKETLEDFARCSREPEKIKHYIRCADRLLMDGLLPDDFFAILKEWEFTDKDVESLKSVMEVFSSCSLNTMQMEWLEEYRNSIVTADRNVATNKSNYSDDLIKLFNGNTNLIEQLIGKSDNDIAHLIKKWAKEKDKFGKPLIENPDNYGNKQKFANVLLANGIVKNSNFRIKL